MTDTQTATNDQTDPNAQSPTGVAATDGVADAQDKTADQLLESLVKDWKDVESVESETTPKATVSDDDFAKLSKDVADINRRDADTRFKDSMAGSVRAMLDASEHVKAHYTADDIEGRIFLRAERDPEFFKAFNNQNQNPAGFKTVLEAWSKELGGEIEKRPNQKLTDDNAAMRAAVEGISVNPPQNQTVGGKAMRDMKPQDFAAYLANSAR